MSDSSSNSDAGSTLHLDFDCSSDCSSDSARVVPSHPPRTRPNILLCGTPGTGKTTHAELLACLLPTFTHINIGDLAKQHSFHSGLDVSRNALILDDDTLLDYLEPVLAPGGIILDHHGCDLFPERWLDLVVVLTTSTSVLYERLEGRGYSKEKIEENLECEIMQVLVEEAREGYKEGMVKVLGSDSVDEMERNVEQIAEWIEVLESGMIITIQE